MFVKFYDLFCHNVSVSVPNAVSFFAAVFLSKSVGYLCNLCFGFNFEGMDC